LALQGGVCAAEHEYEREYEGKYLPSSFLFLLASNNRAFKLNSVG